MTQMTKYGKEDTVEMTVGIKEKVIVLVQENPSDSKFEKVCNALGTKGIDPINFINPENHLLSEIYKDIFTDELANQLMGYLVHKQPRLLVWDVMEAIHGSKDHLVVVNVTLLTEEDVRFISETETHVLTYNIEGKAKEAAKDIYEGSKNYRDQVGI